MLCIRPKHRTNLAQMTVYFIRGLGEVIRLVVTGYNLQATLQMVYRVTKYIGNL